MTYSHPITTPKTRRDGLANFVQIIINRIEAGETREALLGAVDLWNDIQSGLYDDAMADAKGYSAIIHEAQAKHSQDIIAATESGFEDGVRAEKARMVKTLGLEG